MVPSQRPNRPGKTSPRLSPRAVEGYSSSERTYGSSRLSTVAVGGKGNLRSGLMVHMNRREFSQAAVSSAGVALLGRPGVPAEERMGAVLTPDGSITDVPGVRVGHFTD